MVDRKLDTTSISLNECRVRSNVEQIKDACHLDVHRGLGRFQAIVKVTRRCRYVKYINRASFILARGSSDGYMSFQVS